MNAAQEKLENAINDAIGRVVGRIELHDEASATDQPRQVVELLMRCRELKAATEAHRAFLLQSSSDTGASR